MKSLPTIVLAESMMVGSLVSGSAMRVASASPPEPHGLRAQFMRMCNLAAAEMNKGITPFVDRKNADSATHHVPFFEDAHAVRAPVSEF